MIPGLLLIAALSSLGYPLMAEWFGGSLTAWAYVGYGLEAMALWLALAMFGKGRARWALWAVCAFGVFEALQRSACRLMLPMDRPPNLPPGVNLCDAAGIPLTVLAPVAIAFVAAFVAAKT